ncbi:MAG: PspC domain protein, partial [Frankiales bacterium]|nr:PspC domain protein [Frankiales bacterium]
MCGRRRRTIVLAMTETLLPPSPEPPPAAAPPGVRLVRDPSDKVVAGVCAGLARTTGTDPVLWRVVIVVLALFGGAGVLLYGLGWLLVPKTGAPESFVERVVRGGSVPTATAVVLGLLAVVTLAAVSGNGTVPLALLVFGALAVLAVRERKAVPPVPPAPWPVSAQQPPPAAWPAAPGTPV